MHSFAVPAADQAVSESMPEASLDNQLYLTSEFVSQIFDFKAVSMESRGVGLQENSTPWEASTLTSVSESNVVAGSVGSDHGRQSHSPNVSPVISATRCRD